MTSVRPCRLSWRTWFPGQRKRSNRVCRAICFTRGGGEQVRDRSNVSLRFRVCRRVFGQAFFTRRKDDRQRNSFGFSGRGRKSANHNLVRKGRTKRTDIGRSEPESAERAARLFVH